MIGYKQMMVATMAGIMVFAAAGAAWGGGSLKHRRQRQIDRIYQGVRKGEINRGEFARLNRRMEKMTRAKNRCLADGRLSRHERHRLNRMLNRTGRQIRDARNDPRGRGVNGVGVRHGYFH